jgi:hypothetical protein
LQLEAAAVPPSPAQIQKAKDSGNMLLGSPQQGKMRVEFQGIHSTIAAAWVDCQRATPFP